jgi:hypothetical protein
MNEKRIKSVEDRQQRICTNGIQMQNDAEKLNYSLELEKDKYSEYQNFLYKRAMFGLKMYTPEEIKAMHWQKRARIEKVHQRTQEKLNLWKQKILIAFSNKIFGIFKHSPFALAITDIAEVDNEFFCKISFKDLGITKEDIITNMINEGILPHNFRTIV